MSPDMPRGINDYDTAILQRRLWTPEVLRPDAWFDAADLGTITNTATGISDWADKSGNGRTMSRATTTYRPDLLIENLNGRSVVDFIDQTPAGSPDLRVDRLQMSASINVQSAYTAYMRKNKPTSGGSNFIFTADGDNAAGTFNWHGNTGADYTILADTSNSSLNWRNGSNFRNGISVTITATGAAPLDTWAVYSFLCIGNMVTRGIGWDRTFHGSVGRYAEVMWFSAAHSTRERWLIEGYLSWKWGIRLAADHPYANRPPLIGD
jgi:hypothetical protein